MSRSRASRRLSTELFDKLRQQATSAIEGGAEGGQSTAAMLQDSYTDLEEKLARARRERDEALEQQTATSEISARYLARADGCPADI